MPTLYRIVAQTADGDTFESTEVFDHATAARQVRELNERYGRRRQAYIAQAVNLAMLSLWQLSDLFQSGKINYAELQESAGMKAAQQVFEHTQRTPAMDRS